MKKRKNVTSTSNSERYHREKMQRMDRYLGSLDRLVAVLEKQSGTVYENQSDNRENSQ